MQLLANDDDKSVSPTNKMTPEPPFSHLKLAAAIKIRVWDVILYVKQKNKDSKINTIKPLTAYNR